MNEPRYFYDPDYLRSPPAAPAGYYIRDGLTNASDYISYSLERTDAERIVAALNAAEAARTAAPR